MACDEESPVNWFPTPRDDARIHDFKNRNVSTLEDETMQLSRSVGKQLPSDEE
jgi:hypothetical protein